MPQAFHHCKNPKAEMDTLENYSAVPPQDEKQQLTTDPFFPHINGTERPSWPSQTTTEIKFTSIPMAIPISSGTRSK